MLGYSRCQQLPGSTSRGVTCRPYAAGLLLQHCGRVAAAPCSAARVRVVVQAAADRPQSNNTDRDPNNQHHKRAPSTNKRPRRDNNDINSSNRSRKQQSGKQPRPGNTPGHAAGAGAGAGADGTSGSKAEQAAHSTRGQAGASRGSGTRGHSSAAAGKQKQTPGSHQQRHQGQGYRQQRPAAGDLRGRPVAQQCKDVDSLQGLLQLLQDHAGSLGYVDVAAAYMRAAKLCQPQPALARSAAAQQLLQHLDRLLPAVQPRLKVRELSNIIWSCAYTQHVAPVAQLLAEFVQPSMLSGANSFDVANVLLALAKLEQQVPQQQLLLLMAALVSKADSTVPQDISNSLWAVGKLGCQVPQQQLRVLLSAFSTAGMLGQANPQAIANVLLGMAYMGQQLPDAQLQLLLAELSAKAHMADPQELANSLWAVAKLGQQVRDSKQLQQLVSALVSKLSRANPQAIANTLWAMSEMGQQLPDPQLQAMLAALVKQLHRAAPQAISNTLLACARFRYVPVQLLAALEQQQRLQQFLAAAKPQELANTAWACGMLGHNSKLLLGGLLQQAVMLLQQDDSMLVCPDLCHLCWAVAVLDMQQYVPDVLQLAAAVSRVWGSAVPEGLQQLYQVHLWLLDSNPAAAEGARGAGLLQVLSQQKLDECRQAWQDQVAVGARQTPSSLQQQVFAALQQLPGWKVPPKQEVVTADGNFSIDIEAVTAAGVRLAVEVDGPTHFVSPSNSLNGPTQYRNRALAARGYTVISIPYWDWDRLKGSEAMVGYLQRKLQGTGINSIRKRKDAAGTASAAPLPPAPTQRVRRVRRRGSSL